MASATCCGVWRSAGAEASRPPGRPPPRARCGPRRSMIYVDTSVVLAELLAEDRRPRDELWTETLVSSRLLEYELWSRLYGRGLASSHGEAARALVGRLALVEMASPILVRALESFPAAVRPWTRCIWPPPSSCANGSRRCAWRRMTCVRRLPRRRLASACTISTPARAMRPPRGAKQTRTRR